MPHRRDINVHWTPLTPETEVVLEQTHHHRVQDRADLACKRHGCTLAQAEQLARSPLWKGRISGDKETELAGATGNLTPRADAVDRGRYPESALARAPALEKRSIVNALEQATAINRPWQCQVWEGFLLLVDREEVGGAVLDVAKDVDVTPYFADLGT
ncbi:hypothetical protein BDV29DRAFT_158306 [Aspergillus leporis]|uniref:Uncharacterized protein n=1 Tax=Aspergillus leporis TaxID=41062 RepID=A0A5N5WWL8_9EURO|nr:hypothetical protein BDV29DRAFT_158306 [Aspergillus leporis]